MSDVSVHSALRSHHSLVLVEAPAGCGKTHQGSEYARDISNTLAKGRPLILAHTHAACAVFAERTTGVGAAVSIRTIDSLVASVAAAYHVGLEVDADIVAWVRKTRDGHTILAQKVSAFLRRHPMVAESLARRYPVVVCDEHQDSSTDQHAIVMALHSAGAKVRIFADPMQSIFRERGASRVDWNALRVEAGVFEELSHPHRWGAGYGELGAWTLEVRRSLQSGQPIDLRANRPNSVEIVLADNIAQRRLEFSPSRQDRRPIDRAVADECSLMLLTRYNDAASSYRGVFGRRIPLWEGHTRSALDRLVADIAEAKADSAVLARALVRFMGLVAKGFSPSSFGDAFVNEAAERCTRKRTGRSATIQALAALLVSAPDHKGVSAVLRRIAELARTDAAFSKVEIDRHSEFHDAIRLGGFESAEEGLAQMSHRRSYAHPQPPAKAISTIHKAKGLECDSVILMPCSTSTFPDDHEARCLLYVAISRARKRLMLVVSRSDPSTLFVM